MLILYQISSSDSSHFYRFCCIFSDFGKLFYAVLGTKAQRGLSEFVFEGAHKIRKRIKAARIAYIGHTHIGVSEKSSGMTKSQLDEIALEIGSGRCAEKLREIISAQMRERGERVESYRLGVMTVEIQYRRSDLRFIDPVRCPGQLRKSSISIQSIR